MDETWEKAGPLSPAFLNFLQQNVPTNFAFRIQTDISCVVITEDGQELNVNKKYNRNNEQISHGQGDLIVCGAKQMVLLQKIPMNLLVKNMHLTTSELAKLEMTF